MFSEDFEKCGEVEISVYSEAVLMRDFFHMWAVQKSLPEMNITMVEGTVEAVPQYVELFLPDVAVFVVHDAAMLTQVLEDIRQVSPRSRILLVATEILYPLMSDLLRSEMVSYAHAQHMSLQEFTNILGQVLKNRRYRDQRLISAEQERNLREIRFTDKEREVYLLLKKGTDNVTIAKRLGVHLETIRTHMKHIRMKLGLPNSE